MSERPKRDVPAKSAIGQCDHCGGHANSMLDNEHIWRCSEVVTVTEVRELRDELNAREQNACDYAVRAELDRIVTKLNDLLPEGER